MSGILALVGNSSPPRVSLAASYGPNDETISPTNPNCRLKLTNGGDVIQTLVGNGATDLGDWIAPKFAAGAAYECRATVTSGSLSSGTSGSWLALSSDQEWGKTQTTLGSSSVIFTLEIRRASDGTVLATSTVTLTAIKST